MIQLSLLAVVVFLAGAGDNFTGTWEMHGANATGVEFVPDRFEIRETGGDLSLMTPHGDIVWTQNGEDAVLTSGQRLEWTVREGEELIRVAVLLDAGGMHVDRGRLWLRMSGVMETSKDGETDSSPFSVDGMWVSDPPYKAPPWKRR